MVTYTYRDKEYSIVPCTLEDIPSHIERVLSYWKSTGTDLKTQYELLKACVLAGKSFKVITDNKSVAYFYTKPITKYMYMDVYTWFKNGIALAICLDYVYHYTSMKSVQFLPHQRDKVSYKRLLTKFNLLYYKNSTEPITVDIKNAKITTIYKHYFINKNIQRIAKHG